MGAPRSISSVLVVDDDAAVRRGFEPGFRTLGKEVRGAPGASAACALAQALAPIWC